jgi:predicted nucleic acid-binding Zn ribbon protein
MTRHANVVRIWVKWHLWYITGWNDTSCKCCSHMSKMAYIRDAILLICEQHVHDLSFHPVIYHRCHFTHMRTTFAWRVISPSYISDMPFYSYANNICMTCHFTQLYIKDAILLICEQHLHLGEMTRHANVVRIWVKWHLWYITGWNGTSCKCCSHMSKMASLIYNWVKW